MTNAHYKDINNFLVDLADTRYYDANDVPAIARMECTAFLNYTHSLSQYSTPSSIEVNHIVLETVNQLNSLENNTTIHQ